MKKLRVISLPRFDFKTKGGGWGGSVEIEDHERVVASYFWKGPNRPEDTFLLVLEVGEPFRPEASGASPNPSAPQGTER